MIKGSLEHNTPFVMVDILWHPAVKRLVAMIDTAFDGDVKVSKKVQQEFGLPITHSEKVRLADGSLVEMASALAYAQFKEAYNSVDILIAQGDPVIGTGFLKKFDSVLKIDFVKETVEIR